MKKKLLLVLLFCTLSLASIALADPLDSATLHLPSSLTKIESQAFRGCTTVESLFIPPSVAGVEDAAFQDCSQLSYVFIPETVSFIADNAFEGISPNITFEVFEDSYAAKWAESHGYSFVYAKDTIHQSGDYVYSLNIGKTATIKKYRGNESGVLAVPSELDGYIVTKIGEEAFSYCPASEIILPDTLIELDSKAFYYAHASLINIPESVVTIRSEAFMCSDIEEVFIPRSVTSVGTNPFRGCRELKMISVSEQNNIFGTSGNALISKADMKLISYPYAIVGDTLTIPNDIKVIGDTTFGYEGPDFTKLIIPDSVEEIESSAFCFSSVEHVEIGSCVKAMGNGAFCYCKSLKTVVIKEGTTIIGDRAFNHCDNLESITIPDSVAYIADNAFDYDYYVSIIANPDSYAMEYAKANNIGLVRIDGDFAYEVSGKEASIIKYRGTETGVLTVPSELDGYRVTKIGEEAFSYCPASKIVLPDTLLELEHQAFNYCDMTELILPDSLVKIGSWAFSGCRDIVSIHIPDSVTEIVGNPFYGCHGLKAITVNESHPIFGIYKNVLIQKNNYKLITIPFGLVGDTLTIPDGIKIIGDCAFGYSGPNFTKLIIPDSVEEIEGSAFCFRNVEYVEIGSGVKAMGNGPFSYCKSLKTVVIKEGTTIIGESAFNHCDNLESITIPDSVTYIADNAFDYDYYVSIIANPDSYAAQYAADHGIPIRE